MIDLNKSHEELRNDRAKAEREIFGYPGWIVISIALASVLLVAVVGIIVKQRMDAQELRDAESAKRMEESGVQVWGTLNEEFKQKIWKNGKETYVVSYKFEANNQTYQDSIEVVWDPRRTSNRNVLVTFDPENPGTSKIKGQAAATQISEAEAESYAWKETIRYTIIGIILSLLGGGYKFVSSRKRLPQKVED